MNLENKERVLASALDATQSGVFVLAMQAGYPIVYANQGAQDLLGLSLDQLVGQGLELLRCDHRKEVEAFMGLIEQQRKGKTLLQCRRVPGGEFWGELAVARCRGESRIGGSRYG